ncbi:MAG: hypothetical protein OXH33_02655 [bacterium]|nr:hypothetical protein [bacterium]
MLSLIQDFLASREPLLTSPSSSGFPPSLGPVRVWLQPEPNGLEVVLVESSARPKAQSMRLAWKARNQGRANPVLVVACYPADGGGTLLSSETKAAICGPLGPNPVVHLDLDPSQVERMAEVALDEPNRHAATRFLLSTLSGLDSPVPGLRNEGLLATHELHHGVDQLEKWPDALRRSTPLLRERGRHLVEKLGFTISQVGANTSMLAIQGADRAIAVFCQDKEPFDSASDRFDGASPVSRGLAMADQRNVDWLILTRASEIRLYAAKRDTGVGRKGRAETFVELNLALLSPDRAGYLHLLFSSEALADGGTLADILASSERYAVDLASRLRERVYYETVPYLARAISRQIGRSPDPRQLEEAYQQVMLILFRLLFVAYAEAKDLLPYSTNNHYQDASLTKLMIRLREDMEQEGVRYDPRGTQFWDRVNTLWNAVDQGNRGWGVPAYNGGLFSHDPEISPAGAALSDLSIPDAELVPVLNSLLLDETDEGYGPVDFRALSVREFGTIYEGLLESNLAVAPHDLAVKRVRNQDTYVPARPNDEVVIEAGEVYLHNRSGVRKATGSYFTKPFAVEHLLDTALEAALDHHIERLDRLLKADAQRLLEQAFFDFRCADIAMGSGHFLVAALDRIEARLSAWLALHPVPSVTNELNRLRETALESLGELGSPGEIETSSLIRRQVARHCVYGVDLNPMAVELARLAIWVHTFVPGLPLSFLDHNLVCGDSLTGVGTLDEVVAELDPNADPNRPSLWRGQIEELLERSKASLIRLARTSDATKREIDQAREAHLEATEAVAGAKAVFDLVSAYRAGVLESLPENFDECTFIRLSQVEEVVERIQNLNPVHFPSAFPEVFLRQKPGFDCILGNPPWEKVKVEKHQWWGKYLPGIKSLSVGKMNAEIEAFQKERPDLNEAYKQDMYEAEQMAALIRRTFDLGSGDTDLYQAFGWRFWQLVAENGAIGVVLPRQALAAPGYQSWRKTLLINGAFHDVTVLLNTGGWVFDDIHFQYIIALCSILKGVEYAGHIAVGGPYSSKLGYKQRSLPARVEVAEFLTWTETAALPLFPSEDAFTTFRKLRAHPRLDRGDKDKLSLSLWRTRPYPELHATADKELLRIDGGESDPTANSMLQETSDYLSSKPFTPS